MDKTVELAPCHFCGKSSYLTVATDKQQMRFIKCGNCKAQGPKCLCEATVIKDWNQSLDLTQHLRQYRHNTGEGFVFAYELEGIDRMVARLRPLAQTAVSDEEIYALALDLNMPGSDEKVIEFSRAILAAQKGEKP